MVSLGTAVLLAESTKWALRSVFESIASPFDPELGSIESMVQENPSTSSNIWAI